MIDKAGMQDFLAKERRTLLLVVLLFVTALALRFLVLPGFLNEKGLQWAETAWSISAELQQVGVSGLLAELTEQRAIYGILQLSFLMPSALVYALFGLSVWTSHFIPILSSGLCALLIYALVRRFAGNPEALVAMFLWVLLPLDAYYATTSLLALPLLLVVLGWLTLFLLGLANRRQGALLLSLALLGFLFVVNWALGGVLLAATALIVFVRRFEGAEAREALLGRVLVVLALGILLLNLLLPQVAEFSWQLYGAFLGRREFAIFLPLFLFALGHAFMRSWPGARALLASLAVAYLAALAFSVPGA
ncbi:MAG TPA: glycosyltransferase family 39 protein, partial [Anaerolineales bacterium]